MRRWLTIAAVAGGMLFLGGNQAWAQDDDYDGEDEVYNWALAVGVGLVEPANQTETYLTAAFRMRVARGDEEDEDGYRRARGDKSIQGYLEPEIGYWESTNDLVEGSDLLVGLNLIGAFPFAAAETFLGVGIGAHFIDASLLEGDPRQDGSDTRLGVNAQFGLDLHLTRSLSAFGAGRFDLVQGAADEVQSKAYLGLRARF